MRCSGTSEKLAAAIRAARLERGMTQAEVAALVGTSQSVIARWETGDHEFTLTSLRRLAAALGRDFEVCFLAAGEP